MWHVVAPPSSRSSPQSITQHNCVCCSGSSPPAPHPQRKVNLRVKWEKLGWHCLWWVSVLHKGTHSGCYNIDMLTHSLPPSKFYQHSPDETVKYLMLVYKKHRLLPLVAAVTVSGCWCCTYFRMWFKVLWEISKSGCQLNLNQASCSRTSSHLHLFREDFITRLDCSEANAKGESHNLKSIPKWT